MDSVLVQPLSDGLVLSDFVLRILSGKAWKNDARRIRTGRTFPMNIGTCGHQFLHQIEAA
ncbi:MAG: hypothetical protein CFE26_02505 [Verrucomicrobiales bacterium VVV1]|nr:MAG: hypothetical protein CFE26_02505 [Verrucomicrobiales bacterium VVV1]